MATKLKTKFQKSSFFLNGPAFTPHHPLNGLAISGDFFCGFPCTKFSLDMKPFKKDL